MPFECEACGLTGEVDRPRIMESVSCPECNARYLYWPEGKLHGEKTPWKCVVRPYFAHPPNAKLTGREQPPVATPLKQTEPAAPGPVQRLVGL